MDGVQSANLRSDFELKSSDNSQTVIPIPYQVNVEVRCMHFGFGK